MFKRELVLGALAAAALTVGTVSAAHAAMGCEEFCRTYVGDSVILIEETWTITPNTFTYTYEETELDLSSCSQETIIGVGSTYTCTYSN